MDFHNCAEQNGVASEQARSSRHARRDVCIAMREKEKYGGETRPPFGLCASHCSRMPLHSLSLHSLPFRYTYLVADLRDARKIPVPVAGMINEGSGRESRRVGVGIFFQRVWHGDHVHLLRPIGTAGNVSAPNENAMSFRE